MKFEAGAQDLKKKSVLFIQEILAQARTHQEPWVQSWTPQQIEGEIAAAELRIFEDDEGRPIGFCFFRKPGLDWEITLVAFLPEFRGLGHFKRCMEQLRDEILAASKRAASPESLALEVREDNRGAQRAYEKVGFKPFGRRERYYGDGTAAILYRWI